MTVKMAITKTMGQIICLALLFKTMQNYSGQWIPIMVNEQLEGLTEPTVPLGALLYKLCHPFFWGQINFFIHNAAVLASLGRIFWPGTLKEWSAPMNTESVAGRSLAVTPFISPVSASLSFVPCKNSIGTSTPSKRAGLQMFLKGKAESWEDGNVTVDIMDGQASFMVSPFLNMNMWVSVPEDIEELKAGDVADVYPLLPSAS